MYIYVHFTVTITLGPYKHYIETGRFSWNIIYTDTSMTQITTATPIFTSFIFKISQTTL